MKIKSLTVGLMNGLDSSLDKLDEMVAELGDVEIHDWVDTFYTRDQANENGSRLVRVVKYSP